MRSRVAAVVLAALLAWTIAATACAQHAPGAPDRGFGVRGLLRWRSGAGEHYVSAIAIAADGSIVGVGHMPYAGGTDATAFRLTPNGRFDRTFGHGGTARAGTTGGIATAVALAADGTIAVAGYFVGGHREDLVLARLLPDGSVDPSFGVVTHDFDDTDDRPSSVLALADGSIVVVGYHSRPSGSADEYETYVARFDRSGALDQSFGSGGVVFVDATPGREFSTRALLAPDGSIVVSGYDYSASTAFALRVTPDGRPDPTFGDGGVTVVASPPIFNSWGLALDPQGRVLVGIQTMDHRAGVVRLTSDGGIDPSWGGGGVALSIATAEDAIQGLVVQADGCVVGAGLRGLGDDAVLLLTRFAPDGALDATFGRGGWVTTPVLGGGGSATGIALDARGRLVLGGHTEHHLVFARYWL